MQCLYNLKWFSHCLKTIEAMVTNKSSLTSTLNEFFSQIPNHHNKNNIDLITLKILSYMRLHTDRNYYPNVQQDPSEFFLHMLSCIHANVINPRSLAFDIQDDESLENSKSSYFQYNLQPLTKFLTTFSKTKRVYNEHAHEKKNQICNTTIKYQYSGCPILSLELISQETNQNVQQMLEFKISKITTFNDLTCSNCESRNVTGTQQEKIIEFPQYLIIVLQRFTDGGKNTSPITVGNLDDKTNKISLALENMDFSYTLDGCILHYGPNAMSGHYVSCLNQNNKWFKVDDDKVSKCNPTTVRTNSDNYMLFYKRNK